MTSTINPRPALERLRTALDRNRADVLAVACLALWPLVFFWPEALRLAVFSYGDILLFFYPTHLAYANALHQMRLPLWDPNMFAGFPLFAEGQIAALYPLHPLLYGLLPIDIATNYDILLHLGWVAIGTYLFARSIELRRPSAFLAAFAFSTGGFFMPRLQHMSVLATAAWLPWLLWAWEKYEQEPRLRNRLRWFALLALMAGIQLLGGHPQFAFSSAVLVCLYALVRWGRQETRAADRLDVALHSLGARLPRFVGVLWMKILEFFAPTRLIPVVLFFALGAALAAVQLVSTFELSGFTNRAGGLAARFFNAYSLRLPHLLMFGDPFLMGNPWPRVSVEVVGYVGLLTLFLALSAGFLRRDRRVAFLIIIALVALYAGLGDQSLLYRALRHLPLFNYFRVPSRFLFWYTFVAALLAGITFDYFLARAPASARVTRGQKMLIAAFVILGAIVVALVPAEPVDFWLSIWKVLPLALAFASVWILLGARRGLFARTTLVTLVLGLTVLDLALFAAVYAKTYNSSSSVADFYRPPDSLSALKGLTPGQGRTLTSTWIFPWQQVMRESLYPNVALIHNVPSAVGYTPLIPQLTSDYIDGMTAQLFNLLNIRYYLIPQMLPTDPRTEGDDVANKFTLDPINRDIAIPPTAAIRIRISSSIAQSVQYHTGDVAADIFLVTQDGRTLRYPLRIGLDTAEWAYERADVRKIIQYPMPAVATTYPAQSAFPTQSHLGHTFQADFELMPDGKPAVITGMYVYPKIPLGLLRIEQVSLISPTGAAISVAHLVGRDDQRLIYRTNDVAIYENPDALPRTFIVHSAHLASDTEAESEIFNTEFNPRDTLVLAGGDPVQAGGAQRAGERAQIVEYDDERVVLSVHAEQNGYVLLSDSWYPGWTARVDGVETPIQRADLILRAVRVSAGDHRIEMEFHPRSLLTGGIISLLALIIIGGIFLASRRAARVVV